MPDTQGTDQMTGLLASLGVYESTWLDLPEDIRLLLRLYAQRQGRWRARANRAISQALAQTQARGVLGTGKDRRYTSEYLQGRRDALRELHESGGVAEMQLGLEVLYLLPDEFVTFYQQLFHRALRGADGQAISGKGGGIEKSTGRKTTGIVLGSETNLQVAGTGKRYKNPAGSIGSEKALKVKEGIDKELMALVGIGLRRLSQLNQPDSNRGTAGQDAGQCRGSKLGRNNETKRCGRFLKAGWEYCPSCGTPVGEKS